VPGHPKPGHSALAVYVPVHALAKGRPEKKMFQEVFASTVPKAMAIRDAAEASSYLQKCIDFCFNIESSTELLIGSHEEICFRLK
jgi:hypothetical protein